METRCADATDDAVAAAADILRQGGLVAFPTETVYGLGADATNDEAVAKIYAAKRRPAFNPLIAHVDSMAEARQQAVFSNMAEVLAAAFWPGPLTLVLPISDSAKICALARAGQPTVALRMPAHAVALALIGAAGRPLAAPSANRSGRISPVAAEDVLAELDGSIDMILRGGACHVGVESTIIACLDETPRLLRPGGIARETIEAITRRPLAVPETTIALSPGMLASHYAPRALLRLEAKSLKPSEAGLDFGGIFQGSANASWQVLDLSPSRDLNEAAANLFHHMRQLDRCSPVTIAVAPIPQHGLGEAINDRIRRAAAPRG